MRKRGVKDNLPDFEPVLYPVFQTHHITYNPIDWGAINHKTKHRESIFGNETADELKTREEKSERIQV